MNPTYYVWNTFPWDNTPSYYTFNGIAGWYTVPRNWASKPDGHTANWIVSPNVDFSEPTFVATMTLDGQMTFFDTGRNYSAGVLQG